MHTPTLVELEIGGVPTQSGAVSEHAQRQGNSLVVELQDTWSCLELLPQLEAFENSVFGPEFAIAAEDMRTWAESGSWFCAAVTGQAVVGRQQIFSILSILVTTTESRDLLLAGQSSEGQLRPWNHNRLNDKPELYLASVISTASDHLGLMYESLARDLHKFKATWDTDFRAGFSIASGPAGFSHMARNGFRPLEGQNYRGHYPIMVIDANSAGTTFWRDLLSSESSTLQQIIYQQPKTSALSPAPAIAS